MKRERGYALSETLKIAKLITGRWMSIKDLGEALGYDVQQPAWKNNPARKRICRAINILEGANFPLQVDSDRSDQIGGRDRLYYRLRRGWGG